MGIFTNIGNKLKGDTGKFNEAAKNLGSNVENGFKELGKGFKTGSFGAVGEKMVTVMGQPVRWAVKAATLPVRGVSFAFKKAPRGMAVATIAAAVWGVSKVVQHRAEKRTEREAMDQMAEAQAIAQAQQDVRMNAGQQQQPGTQISYQNSVTPEEYARYQEALNNKPEAAAGHAAAVEAARQQGTAVATSI